MDRLGLGSGPHDNGISINTVDWRVLVVEGGNVLHSLASATLYNLFTVRGNTPWIYIPGDYL